MDDERLYPGKMLRQPTTEWECEVVERVLAGEDEETAIAAVIQEFLNAADPTAFIDAVQKWYPIPSMLARFVSAMFEEDPSRITNEPVLTYFHVERRGRSVTDDARLRKEWLETGKKAIDEGREPNYLTSFPIRPLRLRSSSDTRDNARPNPPKTSIVAFCASSSSVWSKAPSA
jgi:hypothetical protein